MGSDTPHQVTVQMLWDIEQIKQLKARYFRLLDAKDWDAFAELFTDDCEHHLPSWLTGRCITTTRSGCYRPRRAWAGGHRLYDAGDSLASRSTR